MAMIFDVLSRLFKRFFSSRKAQVFSMIAIMMSILFILIFSNLTHVPLDRKTPIVVSEITRIDTFVKDFDQLVINAIDQSAYGSLAQFALLQQQIHEANQSQYFDNFTDSFESCFEGTTYSYSSSVPNSDNFPCSSAGIISGGYNFSFSNYLDSVFAAASTTFNISISYGGIEANLVPSNNPFDLTLNVSMLVNLSRDDYSWNRFINVQRKISIDGVDHPLIVGRKIKVNPMLGGRNFGIGDSRFRDPVKIAEFIDGGYYFRDNRSPSFVDLFEGNIPGAGGLPSADNYLGITSFLPANMTYLPVGNVYVGNFSSSLEYDYLNSTAYNPDDLRRLDYAGLNNNQIFTADYIEYLGFNLGDGVVLDVAGECDDSGCN